MTINILNVWSKVPKTMDGLRRGDPLAYLRVASEANTFKYTTMYAKNTIDGVKTFTASAAQYGIDGATRSALNTAHKSLISNWATANNVTMFRGIPFERVHNAIPQSLRFLNGSLLETSVGRGIVSKLGGQVAFSGAKGAFSSTATVTGNTAGRVAGKALARVPLIGILISTAFEVPDLIDAWKNGDFGAQLGRSSLNVACTTAGAAIGAAIGSAVPVVGTIIGGFVGGLIGSVVGKGLGRLFFGKSNKEKIRDGEMASPLMRKYSNVNFYNVGKSSNVGTNYTGYKGPSGGDIDVDRLINSINQGMARYN